MTLQERIAAPSAMLARVDAVATEQLTPLVREIDAGLYPQDVMHAFGTAGAFGSHVAPDTKMGTRSSHRAQRQSAFQQHSACGAKMHWRGMWPHPTMQH